MEFLGEHFLGQLRAQRFEQLQLRLVGQAAGGHLGVLEETAGALVGAEEQLLVGPFEVEQQGDGLADAAILEHRAADIEGEALHAHRVVVGNGFLNDPAAAQGRAVIAGGPVLGGVFEVVVELSGLEGFQRDGHVAVVVQGNGVEVVQPAGHRQIGGPPVGDALVAHGTAGGVAGDAIRAAAQRWLQAGAGEVALGGQDLHGPQGGQQLLAGGAVQFGTQAPGILDVQGFHGGECRQLLSLMREPHVLGTGNVLALVQGDGDAATILCARQRGDGFQGGCGVLLGEIALLPPVAGQDLQLADDQRQLAVAAVGEIEAHAMRTFGHRLFDVRVVVAVHRVALADQRVEGEHHILGGNRGAVMEAGLGAQVEAHEAVVRRLFDLFRQQAVFGERLVRGMVGEGVVDQPDHAGFVALGNERVEAVETVEPGQAQGAALGRVRVDEVEVREAGRVERRLVIQRDGVLRLRQGRAGQSERQGRGRQQAFAQGVHRELFSVGFCHQARSPRV